MVLGDAARNVNVAGGHPDLRTANVNVVPERALLMCMLLGGTWTWRAANVHVVPWKALLLCMLLEGTG